LDYINNKIINILDNIEIIIFIASVHDYDKVKDKEMSNSCKESLRLFEDIQSKFKNLKFFIIIFNKISIFRKKIKKNCLKCCFEEYDQGNDFKKAINFIEEKYKKNLSPKQKCFFLFFDLILYNDFKYLYQAFRDIVLKIILHSEGGCLL
jgi:hypothetical protein